ncbi:F-box [Hyphodiscus hymeniophilus]|uniref:F-box n=1 Tax=Hyphodiscus hymeniophilus TaxID=353542 RepID=A0A9P7B0P9_9HELO|nr:F-box [Hyphodiscus hymeniophilus]
MAVDFSMLPQRLRKAPPSSALKPNTDTNNNHKGYIPPPNSERTDRTSFSSIKESNSGGAQSFTDSKTSSYLRNAFSLVDDEDALDDSDSGSTTPFQTKIGGQVGMLNPQSTLHGLVCPCDGFKGWKSISQIENEMGLGYDCQEGGWDGPGQRGGKITADETKYAAGRSPFEMLPTELLESGSIIDLLATDIPPNGFTARNIDLMSLLLTSHGMHAATLATLYSQITIPHSRIFRKFLNHISEHKSLGTIVHRLDISHYNPTGGGQTARERQQTQNLIPATLLQCLDLTPNLREFLAQEHIDDELDVHVLTKLLCSLPKLKALDFCACSSTKFRDSFTDAIASSDLPSALPIKRLSLHENTVLPSKVFTTLLPRLPNLTHLDLAHTRITDEALHSIPTTAKLTHLNLSQCSSLSGAAVVDFLTSHPAAKGLVYLNLAMDAKSADMLSTEDITSLLPILPSTLRSLNLKGSKLDPSHIPALLPLTKHLEELGLGRHLELKDLIQLFTPDQDAEIEEQLSWIPHSLRYIDVSDLSISQLDLGTLLGSSCPLLKTVTAPLEVLELSGDVNKKLEKSPSVRRAGWCVKELGRRYWLVRQPVADEAQDSGERDWKMGASYWGMRKIPVARQEVGGMYGHYMFKR